MTYFAQQKMTGPDGDVAKVSQWGALHNTSLTRLTGELITYTASSFDARFWTTTDVSGTGAALTWSNNVTTVASGTSNSGYARIYTPQTSRLIWGASNLFRAFLSIPTVTVADCTRSWGPFFILTVPSPRNGAYFSLAADGTLSVNIVADASATSVSSGSFNGSVASYTLNTAPHLYEILYDLNKVAFYIDGVLLHTFTPASTAYDALANNWNVPINVIAANSSTGTTSGTIKLHGASVYRVGPSNNQPIHHNLVGSTGTTFKRSSGVLHRIIVGTTVNNATLTIYDNYTNSGTSLGIITLGAAPQVFEFGVPFFTGLYIVSSSASTNITVVYE